MLQMLHQKISLPSLLTNLNSECIPFKKSFLYYSFSPEAIHQHSHPTDGNAVSATCNSNTFTLLGK